MREILFRGRRSWGNKDWIEGDLFYGYNGYVGIAKKLSGIETWQVEPETVGQYTGLTDKNGKKIFEGDIAKGNSEYFAYSHPHGIIVYDSGEFLIAFDKALEDVENLGAWANDIEVIGNIYDNPELMEVTRMDDLISRQAAIEGLAEFEKQRWGNMRFRPLMSDVRMIIKVLSSVDPKQRTGRWVLNKHTDTVLCSQCGKCYGDEYNYCPNCGAKMESE